MKILTILGARPQFIKAASLSRAISKYRSDIDEIIVHTGQHYDSNMSDVFFDELEIPRPHVNLAVGGGSHGENTGRMLEKLEALAIQTKPDWCIVYGDTDSTLAGGLAAVKLHIPIAHAEAGLRSFNRKMPEEINRVLTDNISALLWCPTETACRNLAKEGIPADRIQVTGDLMLDTARYYADRARPPTAFARRDKREFALCTIHRAENTDNPNNLAGILSGLGRAPLEIILPIHPRTRKRVAEWGLEWPKNVHIIDPVGYLEMVWLEANCAFIVTDSGGVQKEAFFHGKACITLREETEWVELVEHGWNSLSGTNGDRIAELLNSVSVPASMPSLYGNGDAGRKMARSLT